MILQESTIPVALQGASNATSLASLFEFTPTVAYTLMARPGNNLGNQTLIFSVPMADFFRLSIIANDPTAGEVAQRRLNHEHAFKLGQFMLKGLVSAAKVVATDTGRTEPSQDAFNRVLH